MALSFFLLLLLLSRLTYGHGHGLSIYLSIYLLRSGGDVPVTATKSNNRAG